MSLGLSREQLERVTRHPERQEVPHIAADADKSQELLQCRCPVTPLPPELLARIFELYVAPFEEFTHDTVSSRAPLCLTQVCKLWRAVAESDPHLWTSIQLYFPESHENQHRGKDVLRTRPLFDLYLKRSGALPISLAFTDHRMHHLATNDLIFLLVDLLREHAQRWKRISLQLPGTYFPLLLPFTQYDLCSLEHLCINASTVVHSRRTTGLHLSLKSATNLKSFSYNGPGPSMNDTIDLHWGSLAELSFEYAPHSGKCYTVLQHFTELVKCQNITTCSLGIDSPLPLFNRTITLPRLQTLRVRRLSPQVHAGSVIDFLVLPRLQTLDIDASFLLIWSEHWHNHNFSGLLERSRCSLLRLSIQNVDFQIDEFLRCLALSPALTALRFVPFPQSQDIRDVIHKLNVSPTPTRSQRRRPGPEEISGPLVPQLREITLGSSVKGYLHLIMAMLRSRVGARARAVGVATLRRTDVVFFDLWHEMDVGHVRALGERWDRIARFRADLGQLVSENGNEDVRDDDDQLEASVVVDSPYLPEYIDTR